MSSRPRARYCLFFCGGCNTSDQLQVMSSGWRTPGSLPPLPLMNERTPCMGRWVCSASITAQYHPTILPVTCGSPLNHDAAAFREAGKHTIKIGRRRIQKFISRWRQCRVHLVGFGTEQGTADPHSLRTALSLKVRR